MLTVVLALVSGAISGLLFETDVFYLPGILFAAAVIGGSSARYEKVGLLRMVWIALSSAGGNYAAVHTCLWIHDELTKSELVMGTGAGLVGGALLGVGVALAFPLRPVTHTAIALALGGATLGAMFFFLPHESVSYAVWQGGMAYLIQQRWGRSSTSHVGSPHRG